MADVFIEHMVAKKKNTAAKITGVLYVLSYIFLNLTFLLTLLLLLPAGLVGGGWLLVVLLRGQWVEFEYIVTNGIVDVDKIMGKRRRKRLVSLDCRNFEILAPMSDEHFGAYKSATFVKTLDASSGADSHSRYFAVCPAKEGGKMLLIFEPNEKMLNAFKMYIPRALKQ